MKFHLIYLIIVLLFLNTSCSKEKEKISIIEEESLEMQTIKAYNDGLKELDRGDAIYAAKKFNEAEILFPQSIWASKSSVMSAYSL
jgi:outer membrane protein assembly factor BamD